MTDRTRTLIAVGAACMLLLVTCASCSYLRPRDYGMWKTPIHALGFVSCSGNTPIGWIRSDVASDPQQRYGVIAHETQHIIDFVSAGGCREGYRAYEANPLWFEARAYCIGFQVQERLRLSPPVATQIRLSAANIAESLGMSTEQVAHALNEHCFLQVYEEGE